MNQTPFSQEQISLLEQALDPKRVKHRSGGGGTQLSYLKGYDVINTANRIFGYGNWGYDLMGVELNTIAGDNGEIIGGYYAARVKLIVTGCIPVTEEGVCAIQEGRNPRAKIDAHDMARKGAITDALKRALRCYGDQFGNSLYDTDLVDGQPRAINNNRPANRPTASLPAEQPAVRPVNGNNGNGATTRPAVRPEAAPSGGSAKAPASAAPPLGASRGGELATDQQRQAIRKLAVRQGLGDAELEVRLQGMYGCGLAELNKADASHFIQELQKAAA